MDGNKAVIHDSKPKEKYGFPNEPWPIQVEFMDALYECIDNHQIGIFESPTGSGKSLSLICGSLTWLKDNRFVLNEAQVKVKLRSLLSNEKNDEPKWVQEQALEDKINQMISILDIQRKNRESYDNQLKNIPSFDIKNDLNSFIKKRKRSKYEIPEDLSNDNKVNESNNLSEFAKFMLSSNSLFLDSDIHNLDSFSEIEDIINDYVSATRIIGEEDDNRSDTYDLIQPKIYVCSRTHSQLAQFAHELRKTVHKDRIHTVTIGSRKNTCLNGTVRNLKSLNYMNEACRELIKNSTSKCEYYKGFKEEGELYSKLIHKDIEDLEDIVKLGQGLHCCPYFGSRKSLPQSDVILLPYNLIFQKSARESLGIDLRNSIIIIDEAHNIIDAITSMYSVELYQSDLKQCLLELNGYITKFEKRFSSSKLSKLRILTKIIMNLDESLKDDSKLKSDKNVEIISSCTDFLHDTQLDVYNMFDICQFVLDNKVAFKIQSYTHIIKKDDNNSKQIDKDTNLIENKRVTGRPVLQIVTDFINMLTNSNSDGRVIINFSEKKFKYTLLHPGKVFNEVAQLSRSIILAGGTMKPVDDILYQLLNSESIKRLKTFSCGHVVNKSNIKLLSLTEGPSKTTFNFRYTNRENIAMLNDFGIVLSNIVNIVPGGIVIFFPSFSYMNYIISFFKSKGIWTRLESKKHLFVEPKDGSLLERMLKKYNFSIDQRSEKHGAVLFSVVGGKLSEGINFSNDYGRMVIMVGLPYPNLKSVELQEKMKYVKEQSQILSKNDKCLKQNIQPESDVEYYENLCMKAVNQSIGRVIRHKEDYAIILLLDERYLRPRILEKIPEWIKPDLPAGQQTQEAIQLKHFSNLMPSLVQFFRVHRPK